MTHRVNTPMEPMQPASTNPTKDRVIAQTRSMKLRNRDDAVLTFRDSRYLEIWIVTFLGHMPNKATATLGSPL